MSENNHGQFSFRPKARLIKTIGEELISNDNVAITELVKNSYDAGSCIVDITFEGTVKEKEVAIKNNSSRPEIIKYIEKTGAIISIYDEGEGMDFHTIETAWMEPATNFKKKKDSPNPKRKFSGEKGIGRFASAKLSQKLELITRKSGENEIVVVFDWNAFSDEDSYLEDVKVDWEIREPKEIANSGTLLRLTGLNEDWDEDKIRDLRIALSRLLNPIVPTEDFLISINLPKSFNDSLSGIIHRPDTLNRPNYSIKGSISANGDPLSIVFYSKKVGEEERIPIEAFSLPKGRSYSAGPFSFEFKIWDRDSESLGVLADETKSIVRNVKKDLDDLCGISIYRDNIRVLPYGNQNNDWVRLDLRRVNNPTLRLSNNQIVGYVSIGLSTNPELKDQSNREGIVESNAFEDLKEWIKLILNEVEQRRYKERPRENGQTGKRGKSLFENFSLASISKEIKENNPDSSVILNLISQKEIEIQDAVAKVQEVISRYRRLSTLGQLVDPILHDGNNLLHDIEFKSLRIIQEARKENTDGDMIVQSAEEIRTIKKDFSQLFRRLEPFGGKKRGRPQKIVVEEVIRDQYMILKEELNAGGISFTFPDTNHSVTIDESDLSIVLFNLLQNSIYWLSTVNRERYIKVEVFDNNEGLSIIVSDNGPGIKPGTENSIYDPYFSTKPDGIGLGLAIVGEIMAEYNGELSLISTGENNGATFNLLFRKRV